MGEIIKKPVENVTVLNGYSLVFLFTDPDANAVNPFSCLIEYKRPNLNPIYNFSGTFVWQTSAAYIQGLVTLNIGYANIIIISGITNVNKELSNPNHFVFWDGNNDFRIESTLQNHTSATYSFNFIFSY